MATLGLDAWLLIEKEPAVPKKAHPEAGLIGRVRASEKQGVFPRSKRGGKRKKGKISCFRPRRRE